MYVIEIQLLIVYSSLNIHESMRCFSSNEIFNNFLQYE